MESIDRNKGHFQNQTMAINFLASMLISCHMLFGRHRSEFTSSMGISAGLLALLLEKVRPDFKREKTGGKISQIHCWGGYVFSFPKIHRYQRLPKHIQELHTFSLEYFLGFPEFKQLHFQFNCKVHNINHGRNFMCWKIFCTLWKSYCFRLQYNIKAFELYFIKYKSEFIYKI